MAEQISHFRDHNTDTGHGDEFEARADRRVKAIPYFKTLTTTTLVFSALTLILLITNFVLLKYGQYNYTRRAIPTVEMLGLFMFVSLTFSVINVLVDLPIILNFVVDIVVTTVTIIWAVRVLYEVPWVVHSDLLGLSGACPRFFHLKLNVDLSSYSALYIALLALLLFSTKFWKRPLSLNLPNGKVTLEINLKYIKRGSVTTGDGQTAEDSSVSGHGPLYL
ncbi:hypothetical protein GALMADRAFT_133918 [Galerina marginata CBS 339.88]|uniref:Uncharacterized protein n=1 Tax=Galerina marginata (strain CBS 339.88) TaxID=685588 RepID=A0A067TXF7_GALM3|nr:hypothetical protein GALMADRAFT_133918 [Galerina marginata CBS 339.88]